MIPTSALDPFSAAFFDDPFPAFDALREAGPVVRFTAIDSYGAAGWAEVHAILHDHETFCSRRGVGLADFAREKPWRPASLVLEADPPDHTRARHALARALAPGVVAKLRPGFIAAAETLVESLLARGEVDGITDIAEAFPLSVFPEAMGLMNEGRDHLLPYGALAFNAFGPDNALRRAALAAAAPHIAWVTEQCRLENLRPGGIGAAIHAAPDITPDEAVLLVRSLLTAGLDTTVHGVGAALLCLAENPAEWARLRENPTLARAAFEEAIRLESPVQTFFRTTTTDAPLGGETIPEGQKVLMFLGAANRDPRKFENPARYDITRRTAGHVGFGNGIHLCIGALLARIEADALLTTLAARVRFIEIAGPPTRKHNNTLRGLAHLPLRLIAA